MPTVRLAAARWPPAMATAAPVAPNAMTHASPRAMLRTIRPPFTSATGRIASRSVPHGHPVACRDLLDKTAVLVQKPTVELRGDQLLFRVATAGRKTRVHVALHR